MTTPKPGKASKPANRRSSQRKTPRRSVRIECRKGALGLGPNIACGFLDVSEGGVRMIVKEELEVGGEAEVILSSHGIKDAIKRVANVCWLVTLEGGQHAVGLHFQKLIAYRDVQLLAAP
jgi:hypothetical protein